MSNGLQHLRLRLRDHCGWRTIPSWGVVAGVDKAIPAAVERWDYQRAGARRVVEVRGASHVVMISHPDVVERLMEEAATATR
ncbi:alpha/beta fold hydrolase [Streptomyces sp. NBC_00873]|uniref:alpha/beta fold hydrolase n=1 Tax=unclassified Streptomyces TaxID=2593676 RepID=UPI003864ACA6|nr:alpha/beta fold hydrolase [Streptomyces sp. NBC_00873]WSY97406.1 alpha/beta fold hydrolase [Streptomyces sp. NBC_00873]WTA48599.1 alpha/beta fold hydrolase [Streptomyces sp. NBC_00842]WTA49075.1 alpha/beta fold hydrolase [Streptomyces sp. NBC_00842]